MVGGHLMDSTVTLTYWPGRYCVLGDFRTLATSSCSCELPVLYQVLYLAE